MYISIFNKVGHSDREVKSSMFLIQTERAHIHTTSGTDVTDFLHDAFQSKI